MDVEFYIAALEEALAHYGRPEIFNTDQDSQFTSPRFTGISTQASVRVSMDGLGRWTSPTTTPKGRIRRSAAGRRTRPMRIS